MMSLMCGILKNDANELNLQNRNRPTDFENKLMVTQGKVGRGREKLGV